MLIHFLDLMKMKIYMCCAVVLVNSTSFCNYYRTKIWFVIIHTMHFSEKVRCQTEFFKKKKSMQTVKMGPNLFCSAWFFLCNITHTHSENVRLVFYKRVHQAGSTDPHPFIPNGGIWSLHPGLYHTLTCS